MDLQPFADRIQTAHDRLGQRRGWRFLSSPAATLSPSSRLAFIGLNPSGSIYAPPQLSVEAGNAYRVERWGRDGQPNLLQVQVRRMYEALAREAGAASASALMDETLAGNFCPFRSPSWAHLERRHESIDFSRSLWADVFDVVRPRAVICLGESARWMREVLTLQGAEQVGVPVTRRVELDEVTYSISRHASHTHSTVLIGLPHLSRFPFFGRPQSREAVADFCAAVLPALRAEERVSAHYVSSPATPLIAR
jgi:hypothetical protein